MDEALPLAFRTRIAAELDRARVLLETLAVRLCVDPVVFERHAEPLQRFDEVTQVIGEVARLLRCRGTPEDALAGMCLDAMRERVVRSAAE